ncbi:hypothetical protein I4U23_026912 [Adineta vaga]|nr:hypothetical protein I4U23_026912 [Adineta vaga]
MTESLNTTITNENHWNSRISFYEYPSNRLSNIVTLPISNRDQLLDSLESLTLKIKTLENERKKAEHTFQEITGKSSDISQAKEESHVPLRIKSRAHCKNKPYNSNIPFILGKSTTPSHNVKSNIQSVMALLKTHNHRLCLSSKEYLKILHPSQQKHHLSTHEFLYLDHYKKPIKRSSSVSRTQSAATNQYDSRIEQLLNEYIKLLVNKLH